VEFTCFHAKQSKAKVRREKNGGTGNIEAPYVWLFFISHPKYHHRVE
jgi:hypothetical protein